MLFPLDIRIPSFFYALQQPFIHEPKLILCAPKACNLCREKRVRCQLGSVDAPHKPPCARCRRENRECRFSATRKRTTKRPALPLHSDNYWLEKSASTPTTDGVPRCPHSVDTSTRAQNNVRSDGSDHPAIVSASGCDQMAAKLLHGPVYTSNDTLNLLHEASQYSEQEHARAIREPPSSTGPGNPVVASLGSTYPKSVGKGAEIDIALEAWNNLRFVRAGLFSAEEALAFVNHFYGSLAPFSPVLSSDFKHPSQHPKLLEEEPILTVTILMLASRYMELTGPGAISRSYVIHDRLWKYLQGMISRIFWSEEHSIGSFGPGTPFSQSMSGCNRDPISSMGLPPSIFRSLGTCEALLLLLEWHPRALHFPSLDEDTTSIIVKDKGTTHPSKKDSGRYGRLRSGIDWLARSDRMCWSLLGTALSVAVELGVFDEYDNPTTESYHGRDIMRDPSQDQRAYRIQQLICAYSIQTSEKLGITRLSA